MDGRASTHGPRSARVVGNPDLSWIRLSLFIFEGETDVLTTPREVQAFLNDVDAPFKHFSLIADAGHFAALLRGTVLAPTAPLRSSTLRGLRSTARA